MKKLAALFILAALTALMVAPALAQSGSGGKQWEGSGKPVTKPTNFNKNDTYRDTLNKITYKYSTTWYVTTDQREGDQGPKGDTGPMGPQGPAGTSGGGGSDGKVRTWAELITALQNDNIHSVTLGANITAQGKWRVNQNFNGIKVIHGEGYQITIPSNIDTFIVRSYSSLSAADAGIDMQLRIDNLVFQGQGQNIPIYMEANYGSKFEGCRFYDFKECVSLKWCMGTVFDQCYFWDYYIGIKLDYARFVGGGPQESQSNHPFIINCKFRSTHGGYANIQMIAVSGAITYHNIFEGVTNLPDGTPITGSDYFVDFNYGGSSTTKDYISESDHVEQSPEIAAFNIRIKEGYPQIKNQFPQKPGTYIKFNADGAYAKMLVGPFSYVPSGLKFENTNGGRWQFINMPAEFNAETPTNWVGTIPSWSQTGYATNGQVPFTRYPDGSYIQVGNKKYTSAP
jgi:hypothetical protein